MTEVEFQNFLLGECKLQGNLNYYWFNLLRDLAGFKLQNNIDNNRSIFIISTHDVYRQLFDLGGKLKINNFNRLVDLSNDNYDRHYSCDGYEYWRLIKKGNKKDMKKYLDIEIYNLEEVPILIDKLQEEFIEKNCFETIERFAIMHNTYFGITGSHIFSINQSKINLYSHMLALGLYHY